MNTMPEPIIALAVALVLISIALGLFYPRRGLIPRWRRARQQAERIRVEDALKHILVCEMNGDRFSANSLAGALQITVDQAADLQLDMEHRNLLHAEADSIRLTPVGRQSALHILRAHRLWERYLADETGIDELEWHGQAESFEHELTPEEAEALAARLGNPTHDPHGDPIPSAEGEMKPHGGLPLTAASVDEPLRIVHLEDEPQAVFAQLLAEGLYPGMEVRVVERSPHRIRFWASDDEHLLAPVVAANVSVAPLEDGNGVDLAGPWLSDLAPGERGEVVAISSRCRGLERRRLQDLGFLPGAEIQAELTSSGGDPVGYRMRGALIALRKEQADLIRIQRAT
ncbi:MAG: iron dependent repressor, metal binding and dimerization domain protein [Anaerolineales bacterium]